MQNIFLIVGIILTVIGAVWAIYRTKNITKYADKYTDELLAGYGENDVVPEDIAKKFLKKGIKHTIAYLLVPYVLILIGSLLINVFTR